MATEPTKPSTVVTPAKQPVTEQTAPAFTFSKELLQKRLESIKSFQMTFKGKPGHNPYIWISRNVTPLEQRLNGISTSEGKVKPEQSKELHDKIMALPLNEIPKTT